MTRDRVKILDLKISQKRVMELISENMTTWEIETKVYDDIEYVNVTIEFTVGGAIIDREEMILKMYVDIHKIEPMNEATKSGFIIKEIEKEIGRQMPFLIKDTYVISLDKLCTARLNKQHSIKMLHISLDHELEMCLLDKDSKAEALKEYLEGMLDQTKYDSIEEIGKEPAKEEDEERALVELIGEGAPCPLCKGILSYDVLRRLYYRLLDDCC